VSATAEFYTTERKNEEVIFVVIVENLGAAVNEPRPIAFRGKHSPILASSISMERAKMCLIVLRCGIFSENWRSTGSVRS
jgi:hypothetical protein